MPIFTSILKSNLPSSHEGHAQPAIKSIAPPAWRWITALAARPACTVLVRVLGAVGGGYAFTAAAVAALSAVLPLLGIPRSEAVVLASMLGFVVYLLVLLWAFNVRSLARLWTVLALGTLVAAGFTFVGN